MIQVSFDLGTVLLDVDGELPPALEQFASLDPRVGLYRSPGHRYADVVTFLHREGIPYRDSAKAFSRLALRHDEPHAPRPYQAKAVTRWRQHGRRGVVVLPTGSGKSFVARVAIASTQRACLVVVPTLDLMSQWASQLEQAFECEVGLLGGGSKEIRDLTVSTYDSAAMMMEFIGNRFGMLIVDECHHLPSPGNRQVASMCIAPFRLGLTATPERDQEGERALYQLMGPLVFRKDIDELEGQVLAPYRTVPLELELDPDEQESYQTHRQLYLDFVKRHSIDFGSPNGWGTFLSRCARMAGGREAFHAYLEQKRIARTGRAKLKAVWKLLLRHGGQRAIIFTADNDTAYAIGRQFFLPVLTHRTKIKERREFLERFRDGLYPALVTSRVLNEGVDVPEASVGIVVSGTASVREHVQRLGRILRPSAGKQAVLYELVSSGTSEASVSQRRRKHRAYERSDQSQSLPG